MVRPLTYVAAWMVLSATGQIWAQECTGTFDASAIGLRGRFEQSYRFESSEATTGVQTGSLLITSIGETTPTLPDLEGTWLALNRCQFSVWSVSQNGATGRARGSGITFGDQLIGVLQVSRFEGSVSGVFIVTGEAALEEPPTEEPPMEEPPTEEETNPPPMTATSAASAPTPATRSVR